MEKNESMFHKDRPKPDERFAKVEPPFDDVEFVEMYPTLVGYLRETKYRDGSDRMTSTLLMFFEGQVVKAVINDRDQQRSAFFTATTFADLLDVIELALAGDTVDWRSRGQSRNDKFKTPF